MWGYMLAPALEIGAVKEKEITMKRREAKGGMRRGERERLANILEGIAWAEARGLHPLNKISRRTEAEHLNRAAALLRQKPKGLSPGDKRGKVRMPKREIDRGHLDRFRNYRKGWNDCLDEVRRLNAPSGDRKGRKGR